jgi:hypothetical protein
MLAAFRSSVQHGAASSSGAVGAYRPQPEQFTFGEFSEEDYLRGRLENTTRREHDLSTKICREEANEWSIIWEDHVDGVAGLRLEERHRFRQMLLDFETLIVQDKTTTGVALAEEEARLAIYEDFYAAYTTRVLPVQQKFHRIRVEQQTKLVRDAEAAARRAREAYEQQITTTDERDSLRREEYRERHRIYQQWHDAVVCSIPRLCELSRRFIDLVDTEVVLRLIIILEEEDVRLASLQLQADVLMGCIVEEQYQRDTLVEQERLLRESDLREQDLRVRYELWWLTAKDIPSRWKGETISV